MVNISPLPSIAWPKLTPNHLGHTISWLVLIVGQEAQAFYKSCRHSRSQIHSESRTEARRVELSSRRSGIGTVCSARADDVVVFVAALDTPSSASSRRMFSGSTPNWHGQLNECVAEADQVDTSGRGNRRADTCDHSSGSVISQVDTLAKETADNPNDGLLNDLRALEKKMGLVLTLVSSYL